MKNVNDYLTKAEEAATAAPDSPSVHDGIILATLAQAYGTMALAAVQRDA